jgi:hypothetical protein
MTKSSQPVTPSSPPRSPGHPGPPWRWYSGIPRVAPKPSTSASALIKVESNHGRRNVIAIFGPPVHSWCNPGVSGSHGGGDGHAVSTLCGGPAWVTPTTNGCGASAVPTCGPRIRHARGRRLTGLASRQHPECQSSSQHAPKRLRNPSRPAVRPTAEAAHLRFTCRRLGPTPQGRYRRSSRLVVRLIEWKRDPQTSSLSWGAVQIDETAQRLNAVL